MSATTIIINDETPRRQYTASAGQTVFDFPFPFFADGDLEVYLTPNGSQPNDTTDIQTIVTDYTVTGADTQNGGKITLTSGASAGDIITILRIVDIDRTADYQAAGDLLAETLNAEQDTEIMISQQLREEQNRSIRSQKSDVTVDMTLPSAADRADAVLTFDTNGSPQATSTTSFVAGLSGSILGANYVTNTATGDGSTVNFTVSVAPGAKGNIQIYIDGVYQNKSSFSISGTTVTFTQAPPLNSAIEFIIGYSIGSASGASSVTWTQQGTGAQTRTVEDKLYESVSVKDFGAVGDGVTNDTAAIQAALDSGASSVYVPGVSTYYLISTALQIPTGVKLYGDGFKSRIHSTNTTRLSGIKATGTSGTPLLNVVIDGIQITSTTSFTGGSPSSVTGSGIQLDFCDESIVKNCYVFGWSDAGISINDGFRNKVLDNHVERVAQGIQIFAETLNSAGNIVSNNTVIDTGTYDGIMIEGGVNSGVGRHYNTVVSNNTVKDSYERGIVSNLGFFASITGNTVTGSGVGATASNHGIFVYGTQSSSITGNTVVDSDGYGIFVGADSDFVSVIGNTTSNNSDGSAILSDQATSAVNDVAIIANNFVEGDIARSGTVTTLTQAESLRFSNNNASTDGQTLDWYEEDTFTPVVSGTTSAGAATYTSQYGTFTRIGNTVNFTINVAWSAHTGTGDTVITGLPYTSANVSPYPINIFNNGFAPSSGETVQGIVQQNTSQISLSSYNLTTGAATALPIDSSVAGFVISGYYQV